MARSTEFGGVFRRVGSEPNGCGLWLWFPAVLRSNLRADERLNRGPEDEGPPRSIGVQDVKEEENCVGMEGGDIDVKQFS